MSSTRISDLPENVMLQQPLPQPQPGGVLPPSLETRPPEKLSNEMMNSQTTYVPLNVHNNPYGHPPPPPGGQMSFSDDQPQQQQQQQQQQQHRLPSRDIPMNPLDFQHDAEIQANYIPRTKLTADYVRDYEQDMGRVRRPVHQVVAMDEWYDRLQIPILVALLFFIFQMPVFNTFLRKNFTFMTLYNDDGNFNLVGLVFKSMLFGGLFYGMQQIMENLGG